MQHARLFARVGFDFQGLIILSDDMKKMIRNAHDRGSAVALALLGPRGPRSRRPFGLSVERNAGIVAFRWGEHSEPPVLSDNGSPIAFDVIKRGIFRASWRRTAAGAPALAGSAGRHHNQAAHDGQALQECSRFQTAITLCYRDRKSVV